MKLSESTEKIERGGEIKESSFGIADGDASHILMILRDKLYSDKVGAVVREYCTNAYDAHVQAGKKDIPIQIELPSQLETTFSIRDFGPGLTEEEIRKLYVMYGASTKRTRNDLIGALGLGCKSAFGYTDNFNIISIKSGEKKTYTAYIDESKCGKVALLNTDKTKDEDGIEIQIPVKSKDVYNFNEVVNEKLQYMDPLPIIDGKELKPTIDYDFTVTIENGIKIGYESIYGEAVVVMGTVPYPIEATKIMSYFNSNINDYNQDIIKKQKYINKLLKQKIDLYLNIGDVDISANREALEYTDKTCKTIIKYIARTIKDFKKQLIDSVNKASTLKEAKREYIKREDLMDKLGVKNILWTDPITKENIELDHLILSHYVVDKPTDKEYVCDAYRIRISNNGNNRYEDIGSIQIRSNTKKLYLIEIDNTSGWKSKLGRWCKQEGIVSTGYHYYNKTQKEDLVFAVHFKNDEEKKFFFNRFKLDEYEWLKISDLKLNKIPRVKITKTTHTRAPRSLSHIGKMFTLKEFNKRNTSIKSECWNKITTEIPKGKKYYVEIDRFVIQGGVKIELYEIDYILEILKFLGKEIKHENIIGIKSAQMDKRDKSWIPFIKLCKRVFSDTNLFSKYIDSVSRLETYYSYNKQRIIETDVQHMSKTFEKVKSKNSPMYIYLKKVKEMREYIKDMKKKLPVSTEQIKRIYFLFNKAYTYHNNDVKLDNSLFKIEEQKQLETIIENRYPLLYTGDLFPNTNYVKKETYKQIIDYVNIIDSHLKGNKNEKTSIHYRRKPHNHFRKWPTQNCSKRRKLL